MKKNHNTQIVYDILLSKWIIYNLKKESWTLVWSWIFDLVQFKPFACDNESVCVKGLYLMNFFIIISNCKL
jgi:hypothetical protein